MPDLLLAAAAGPDSHSSGSIIPNPAAPAAAPSSVVHFACIVKPAASASASPTTAHTVLLARNIICACGRGNRRSPA